MFPWFLFNTFCKTQFFYVSMFHLENPGCTKKFIFPKCIVSSSVSPFKDPGTPRFLTRLTSNSARTEFSQNIWHHVLQCWCLFYFADWHLMSKISCLKFLPWYDLRLGLKNMTKMKNQIVQLDALSIRLQYCGTLRRPKVPGNHRRAVSMYIILPIGGHGAL